MEIDAQLENCYFSEVKYLYWMKYCELADICPTYFSELDYTLHIAMEVQQNVKKNMWN